MQLGDVQAHANPVVSHLTMQLLAKKLDAAGTAVPIITMMLRR